MKAPDSASFYYIYIHKYWKKNLASEAFKWSLRAISPFATYSYPVTPIPSTERSGLQHIDWFYAFIKFLCGSRFAAKLSAPRASMRYRELSRSRAKARHANKLNALLNFNTLNMGQFCSLRFSDAMRLNVVVREMVQNARDSLASYRYFSGSNLLLVGLLSLECAVYYKKNISENNGWGLSSIHGWH